jgi:hypothetical protein
VWTRSQAQTPLPAREGPCEEVCSAIGSNTGRNAAHLITALGGWCRLELWKAQQARCDVSQRRRFRRGVCMTPVRRAAALGDTLVRHGEAVARVGGSFRRVCRGDLACACLDRHGGGRRVFVGVRVAHPLVRAAAAAACEYPREREAGQERGAHRRRAGVVCDLDTTAPQQSACFPRLYMNRFLERFLVHAG